MNQKGIVSPVIADIRAGMKRGKIVSVDDAIRVVHHPAGGTRFKEQGTRFKGQGARTRNWNSVP